jgi:hypothetical protein
MPRCSLHYTTLSVACCLALCRELFSPTIGFARQGYTFLPELRQETMSLSILLLILPKLHVIRKIPPAEHDAVRQAHMAWTRRDSRDKFGQGADDHCEAIRTKHIVQGGRSTSTVADVSDHVTNLVGEIRGQRVASDAIRFCDGRRMLDGARGWDVDNQVVLYLIDRVPHYTCSLVHVWLAKPLRWWHGFSSNLARL